MSEDGKREIARLQNALGRVKAADAKAADARRALRRLLRYELETGRVTEAEVAKAFGVPRKRVAEMLQEK